MQGSQERIIVVVGEAHIEVSIHMLGTGDTVLLCDFLFSDGPV
jgi:hypothetical protein